MTAAATKVNTAYVVAALWEAGLDDNDNLTNSCWYNGRHNGEQCFGVICDEGLAQAFVFIAHLAAEDPDLAMRLANAARVDNMGTGTIVYFPGYTLAGSREGER